MTHFFDKPGRALRLVTAAAAVSTMLLAGIAQAAPVYMRSTVGQPWGVSTNEGAMDAVFGVGAWDDLRYETVDTTTLFADSKFIFMEGGDNNADEIFISNGGSVFFNAAPNEGNGMTWAFGVDLVYNPGPFCNSNCDAVDPAHPIFTGPFATTTSFTGGAFSHAIIGAGVTALMEDGSGNTLLGELSSGAGFALYGGMTTTNFHGPNPEAENLRRNILAYAAGQVAQGVPAPATLPLIATGIGLAAWSRRRRQAA